MTLEEFDHSEKLSALRGDGGRAQKQIQEVRDVFNLFGQDVNDAVRVLQPAGYTQHTVGDDGPVEAFIDMVSDDDVHDARFVFECHKDHALGGARTLAQDDKVGDGQTGVLPHIAQSSGGHRRARLGIKRLCGLHGNKVRAFWAKVQLSSSL